MGRINVTSLIFAGALAPNNNLSHRIGRCLMNKLNILTSEFDGFKICKGHASPAASLYSPWTATIAYIAMTPRMHLRDSRLAETKEIAEVLRVVPLGGADRSCLVLPGRSQLTSLPLGVEGPRTAATCKHTFSAFWL